MMKKGSLISILAVLVLLVFSSCATTARERVHIRPIQMMGKSETIVISVDLEKEEDLLAAVLGAGNPLQQRAKRISIAATPQSDVYPLAGDALEFWAVVEGKFPRLVTNTALSYSREFLKAEDVTGRTYFTEKSGPLSIRAVQPNTLLLTDGSYDEAYTHFRSGEITIDAETAERMENAALSIWVKEPKTFFDLGLGLSQSVFAQAESVLILLDRGSDGAYRLDAVITMTGSKDANTLSQMVRSGYIAKLRTAGERVAIAELREIFLLEDLQVIIQQLSLGESEVADLKISLQGIL